MYLFVISYVYLGVGAYFFFVVVYICLFYLFIFFLMWGHISKIFGNLAASLSIVSSVVIYNHSSHRNHFQTSSFLLVNMRNVKFLIIPETLKTVYLSFSRWSRPRAWFAYLVSQQLCQITWMWCLSCMWTLSLDCSTLTVVFVLFHLARTLLASRLQIRYPAAKKSQAMPNTINFSIMF